MDIAVRPVPLLRDTDPVGDAARAVLDSGLPALPVVDAEERLVGIFGEREFMQAVFPGYLRELHSARFVSRSIDPRLELRLEARGEPVSAHANTEHIDVGPEFSDVEVAETFLHHRVLIVPVVEAGRVVGAITRGDFFAALVARFAAET